MNQIIAERLAFVYGDETAVQILPRLERLLANYRRQKPRPAREEYFDEKDAILISYGDMVQAPGERPLSTLYQFLKGQVGGLIRGLHLLPFFPYSSDDGFSVIDYDQVDPALGDWADIEAFGQTFRLMFDAVINHISQESAWFQAYLRGEAPYSGYFIEVDPTEDLSAVFRPRALPLLTPASTANGEKQVWTTFSADQIDLNFASPDLLLEILGVLLNYVAHGAELIRLDAIAYMWKEVGTSCIHLPQTHALIQLMRAVLDEVAPHVVLITETNVPHEENISYFGDGFNEAQMVYNFSLPPLTLHTFHTADATVLTEWAAALETPSAATTFFNFLASHDGIGVTPARGLLSDAEVRAIAQRVEALGGFVSYKNNPDGSQSAYELNINYLDALGDPRSRGGEQRAQGRTLFGRAGDHARPARRAGHLFSQPFWLRELAGGGQGHQPRADDQPPETGSRNPGARAGAARIPAAAGVSWLSPPAARPDELTRILPFRRAGSPAAASGAFCRAALVAGSERDDPLPA